MDNRIISKSDNTKKYFIATFGCQMNAHESEKIKGILEDLSYTECKNEAEADIIVVNTCCIRDTAEQKIRGYVGSLKKFKSKKISLKIVLCGCLTQQDNKAEELRRSFPFVDIFLGTHNYSKLPELINEKRFGNKSIIDITDYSNDYYLENIEDSFSVSRNKVPSASVNIMYGCNNFCSYCIVPYVRGRERSRCVDDIMCEVNQLAIEGYKEVLLLGQNVNSYRFNNVSFSELLRKIAGQTRINRIRFMTSHPKDLSKDLIEAIKSYPNICKQIHLPVQSGSTSILNKMNRGYTREDYLKLITDIRSKIPEITITTDLIVGFPGETDDDFKDTLSLVKEVGFDSAYTFVYSTRTGTKAALMPNKIDKNTCKERIMELIELQNAITLKKNKKLVGSMQQVLAEGISARDKNSICGKTDGGKTVNFKGDFEHIGKFLNIRITEAKRSTLIGEIV